MNKSTYKTTMSAYRKARNALIKQIAVASTAEFLVLGQKMRQLTTTFNLSAIVPQGSDRYAPYNSWVIRLAIDKLGLTGSQAIDLSFRFKALSA
jgi:hypothetical protein